MKWKQLDSKEIFRTGFFRLRADRCEMPDGRVMPGYYVMEFPNWVNIVPVTDDNQIVLVEQYRHATGEVVLEIPGGAMHMGSDADPKQAALRELMEETGYVPEDVRLLQRHRPNPAMQNNYMYTYIGFGCRKQGEPTPDPYEDIRVVTKPIGELPEMLLSGEINHSIVVASLLYAFPVLGLPLSR